MKGVAVNAGVAITATWQGKTGTTNVAVTAPVLQSIAITPASVSLLSSGQTAQLKAMGTFSAGPPQDLTTTATWTSTAPAVATVSSTGLAKAIASGGSLTLFAANPGAWANNLRVGVLLQTSDPTRFGLVQQITPTGQLQTPGKLRVVVDDGDGVERVCQDSTSVSSTRPRATRSYQRPHLRLLLP